MIVLIINLASALDRFAFVSKQLEDLGLRYERIDAVTPSTLSPEAEDPCWWQWERALRITEMATTASHIRAWTRVAELGKPCLVLEDDAILSQRLPSFLEELSEYEAGIDHVSLETRGRKKLVSRHRHERLSIRRLYLDRTGAAAYVLFPSGARKLLDRALTCRGLADAMIATTFGLRSWQADPALAIQQDRAMDYNVEIDFFTTSQIDIEEKPKVNTQRFFARRIIGQLRMGVRQLRLGTVRRHIPLDLSRQKIISK